MASGPSAQALPVVMIVASLITSAREAMHSEVTDHHSAAVWAAMKFASVSGLLASWSIP